MDLYIAQCLTGLAEASSLFLVASGLSIIFGVTRIVNFAHGAFYMLGAYVAYTLTERFTGAFGFWVSLVLAALLVAAIGAAVEMLLLRSIYHVSDLFQLLATFGVTLMMEDLVVLIWNPDDLVGPRAPGLRGAVVILSQRVPSYDLVLMVLGPAVFGLLWLLFHRTRFGVLVRAATQDREMVAALGVNQRWLFTAVFALGVFLAALGGALQIPRDAVNHTMDLRIIVETFVVVVIGGLGSVGGAFLAAVIVAELNAFGILVLPAISIVLIFIVMALVLAIRPYGLLGRLEASTRVSSSGFARPWTPLGASGRLACAGLILVAALSPLVLGDYWLTVGAEILIFMLFAASLQFLMSVGGLVSFGHAAYFGLGAYGAALAVKDLGCSLVPALGCGVALGLAGAVIFGWFCVRLSGVYFAMLTLAFAQIAWSIAFQWTEVTGGDNGLLGIWPDAWAATPRGFFWLALVIAVAGVASIRMLAFSPFGYGVRAVRDSALRSEAIGISRRTAQWSAFVVAGAFAALAGALFAFLKGSVFPDGLGVGTSVDGLVMVLLGGLGSVSGSVAGTVVYKALSIWLVSQTDYSKLVLGAVIIALVVAFPIGLAGFADRWRRRSIPLRVGPSGGPAGKRETTGANPLLAVDALKKSYGGVHAVRGVSFRLDAGEMLAMIGPNGAGKSTCFNMLNGQIRPDGGTIRLRGHEVTGLSPRLMWRRGVGRTFQITATFASMTVRENVQVACLSHAGDWTRPFGFAGRALRAEADRLLDHVGLLAQGDRPCAELAYGDLKRLELAVALTSEPSLLLMDEPTAGMAPKERFALMRFTASLARDRGIGVLFTEHDMDIVFEHADRVMVLNRGEIIAVGTPEAIRRDDRVRATYLGDGTVYAKHPDRVVPA